MGSARIDMQDGRRTKHQQNRNRNQSRDDYSDPRGPKHDPYVRKPKNTNWLAQATDDDFGDDEWNEVE